MPETNERRKSERERFPEEVGKREIRKTRSRKRKEESVWYGLGMFGLVGWAVSVPTLIGLALGLWIDTKWRGPISWTLIGLFTGVVLGCLNAWYWVSKERSRIEEEKKDE
jgi:ATP synthase protein I